MQLKRTVILIILLLVNIIFLKGDLSSLHIHDIIPETCISPSICSLCFQTIKPPHGHKFIPETCTEAGYCSYCKIINSQPRGHAYIEATCTEPKMCRVCNEVFGYPRGHTIIPPDCTSAAYCSVCGRVFGLPLGHSLTEATCVTGSYCSRCNKEFGSALGHDVINSTCTKPKTCRRCNKTFGKELGHIIIPATCTEPEICTRCNKKFTGSLGHSIVSATCTTEEYCSRCGLIFAQAKGHKWINSIIKYPECTSDGLRRYVCSTCGNTYFENIPSAGHSFRQNGNQYTCTVCGYKKVCLDVEILYQGNKYPNGCESVSAVMALRYMGIDISTESFISNYLPMSPLPAFFEENPTAEDPMRSYIGDPRLQSGYYCFAEAIESAVKKLPDISDYNVEVHYNETIDDLCRNYIDKGIPVVLWTTLYMQPISYNGLNWLIHGTKKIHKMISNVHCVVLVGYDDQCYYINDPLYGQVNYNKHTVSASFVSMGSQAITVSKGGSN